MKDKNLNLILSAIQQEVANLDAALKLIEVSNSSIKRDMYCKKHKINYTKFMEMYTRARNEIMMYPLHYHVMINVINQRNKTKKEYKILNKNVTEQLKKIIEEVKRQEEVGIGKGAEEMKQFLEDLNP